MNEILNYLWNLMVETVQAVGISLSHNWKVLAFSILLAVGLKTYVNTEKLSKVLFQKKKISIFASVLFGAFTPLCACGTTAVILGMLTTTLPWGPIMAFLTSSPLMSPDGFVFITGVVGIRFAIALTIASLAIGISSGFLTNIIEKHTNYLTNQSRYLGIKPVQDCGCSSKTKAAASCSCGVVAGEAESIAATEDFIIMETGDQLCCTMERKENHFLMNLLQKLKLREFSHGLYQLGLKQILLFYTIFIAIGYMINYFIPSSFVSLLFGAKAFYAVPLASLIGLPLYLTTGSGIPIVQSLLESGASEGAMLAFMITGSATSAWVIAGLATFMKRRAIALYVMFVLVGGIFSGYMLDLVGLIW
jgi:uncharacterized membrane protein YraQ (UPF0718 family)